MAKQSKSTVIRGRPRPARIEKPVVESPADGPPHDLPTDSREFWGVDFNPDSIPPPENPSETPALKRLGPPPFPRGKFPLVGFLATVYEHVAAHAGNALGVASSPRQEERDI